MARHEFIPSSKTDNTSRNPALHQRTCTVDKLKVQGKVVVLLDDVYTSGATTTGVTSLLMTSGAFAVIGLCCVRTV